MGFFSGSLDGHKLTITAGSEKTSQFRYICHPGDDNAVYFPSQDGAIGEKSHTFYVFGGYTWKFRALGVLEDSIEYLDNSATGSSAAGEAKPDLPTISVNSATATSITFKYSLKGYHQLIIRVLNDSSTSTTVTSGTSATLNSLEAGSSYVVEYRFSAVWNGKTYYYPVNGYGTLEANTVGLSWKTKPSNDSDGNNISFSWQNGTAPYKIKASTVYNNKTYIKTFSTNRQTASYEIDGLPGGLYWTIGVQDAKNNVISKEIYIDKPVIECVQTDDTKLYCGVTAFKNYDSCRIAVLHNDTDSERAVKTVYSNDSDYTFSALTVNQIYDIAFDFTAEDFLTTDNEELIYRIFINNIQMQNLPYRNITVQLDTNALSAIQLKYHNGIDSAQKSVGLDASDTSVTLQVSKEKFSITLEGPGLQKYYKQPLLINDSAIDSTIYELDINTVSYKISATPYLVPQLSVPEDDLTAVSAKIVVSNIDEAYKGTATIKLEFSDKKGESVSLSNTFVIDAKKENINLPDVFNSTNYSQLIYDTFHKFTIVLQSTNGNKTLNCTFTTDNAYLAIINLINLDKITVWSSIEGNKKISSGDSIQVVPNENIKFLTSNIAFGKNENGSLSWNYYYPVHNGSTMVFKTDGSDNVVEYKVDENNKTFTIKAAPKAWSWSDKYLNNVLIKGKPVSDFEYTEWNKLMHCLDTWYKYAGKGNEISGTFMSKTDRTLTKTRYNNAYTGLAKVFTNIDNIHSSVTETTHVSASNLKNFGNIMRYSNYSPST